MSQAPPPPINNPYASPSGGAGDGDPSAAHEYAKSRVGTPALLLMITAGIGIAIQLLGIAANVVGAGVGAAAAGDQQQMMTQVFSGTTGVMAVAAMFAANSLRPARSVLFVCFCGEEMGLLGSTAHAKELADAKVNVDGMITNDIVGYGPLERLLADDSITEIMVNGPDEIWVERQGRLYDTTIRFTDESHLRRNFLLLLLRCAQAQARAVSASS